MPVSFKTKLNKSARVVLGVITLLLVSTVFAFINPALAPSETDKTPLLPKPKQTTLFFAGDIQLSRNVGTKIINANNTLLPFANVISPIKSSSLAFANLESPFYDQGPRAAEGLVFKAEPNTIEGLVATGFDVLSTANNHTLDQNLEGLNYTLSWLRLHNITPIGTGKDCHKGIIKEVDGIKFGFLAYSYAAYNDAGIVPHPMVCSFNDQKTMVADIKTLRPSVDYLIVSAHRGKEYVRDPEPEAVITARALIDAGADLFVGHHPHWIQTMEEYNGKFIFYSLGNFVFDQDWSTDTSEGLTLLITFEDGKLKQVKLQPVILEDNCCPRWTNDEETKDILAKINLTSNIIQGTKWSWRGQAKN